MTDTKNDNLTTSADTICVFEIISGVAGKCLCLNDVRIAGPKPWGGGTVVARWSVSRSKIIDAIKPKDHTKQ
jgi:hypothetical protein